MIKEEQEQKKARASVEKPSNKQNLSLNIQLKVTFFNRASFGEPIIPIIVIKKKTISQAPTDRSSSVPLKLLRWTCRTALR